MDKGWENLMFEKLYMVNNVSLIWKKEEDCSC